jgi:hypothetical protein
MVEHKVALVELGGSHDECMLSQLIALKRSGSHVTLVALQELIDRNPFWEPYVDQYHVLEFPKTAIGDFLLMKKLNLFFQKQSINTVILNTAQGGHVRNLCITSSRKIEFIGIVHTLRKFEGSFTQKIIHRKIKKYLVLNDFFLERIKAPKNCRLASFYPLRFPDFPSQELQKSAGEKWITLIGGVENRRKDLTGSLALMKATEDQNIKYIFLGKSDPHKEEVQQFRKLLKKNALKDKVILFEDFVSPALFDSYLKQTDLIWPMVHPATPSAQEYFRNQISGAINVAFAYKIPLLIHSAYTTLWKDLNTSSPYTISSFQEDLKTALLEGPDRKKELQKNPKFDPKFQEERYIEFVFS